MPPVERIEDVIVALIGGGAVKRAVGSIAVVARAGDHSGELSPRRAAR